MTIRAGDMVTGDNAVAMVTAVMLDPKRKGHGPQVRMCLYSMDKERRTSFGGVWHDWEIMQRWGWSIAADEKVENSC